MPPITWQGQLFTCMVTVLGTVVFSLFNAEVHAIVQASLGASLRRTAHIDDLRTLFRKTTNGGITQRTALQWSATAAREERLQGDNLKERSLVQVLPVGMRVELLRSMYTELTTAECGLEGRCSRLAMAQIAAACWPAIFLPKQVLVAASALSSEVFLVFWE